jgi:uncharacterized protein YjdB
MLSFRRPLAAVLALASWSCGGSTQPDATVQVAAIVVQPSTPTLAINAQLPLQALVQNEAGELVPDASVTWTVENSSVASVSPAGVVTGLAIGSTQVAANARGKSGIATVTVQRTPVASVVVLPERVSAGKGSTTKLTAVAYDAGQNALPDRGMIWTSSNTGVATVDGNGLVTAREKGTAIITATAEGKSDASEVTVAPGAVSKVFVTPNPIAMVSGDKQRLAVSAQDATGTVLSAHDIVWASSNTQVATVSGGEVTAQGAGTASITATFEGVSGSTSVTVTRPPVGTVAVAAATITVGQKLRMTATVTDTRGNVVTDRTVTWSVPANAVASIDASTGEVTGLLPGTVTVTATSEGKSGSATLTVGLVPVATVAISPSNPSIVQNAATKLTAATRDAGGGSLTGRTVTWQTSDPAIASLSATSGASVDVTGGVTGTATITATSEGKTGTATVTVTAGSVSKVRLTLTPTSIKEGTTATATAVVLDGNDRPLQGRTVSWTATGAATITTPVPPATSTTSTGANSAATATVTGKDVIFTSNSNITATAVGTNRSDTKQLTVQP